MDRKGQLVFEFLVAAVLFFGIVIYTLSVLGSSIVGASERSQADLIQARALTVSELLMTQPGVWGAVPQQLGLANESGYPVLSKVKIENLVGNCTDPMPLLDADDRLYHSYHYRVFINNAGVLYMCGGKPLNSTQGTATRIALIFDPATLTTSPATLEVTVW